MNKLLLLTLSALTLTGGCIPESPGMPHLDLWQQNVGMIVVFFIAVYLIIKYWLRHQND